MSTFLVGRRVNDLDGGEYQQLHHLFSLNDFANQVNIDVTDPA